MSKEIRAEQALLRYLRMLLALRGRPHLALLRTATRVRLQAGGEGGPLWGGPVWEWAPGAEPPDPLAGHAQGQAETASPPLSH